MTREEEILKGAQTYVDILSFSSPSDVFHFKNGAKWADEHPNLKSIWHDAGEEPEDNSHILIRYNYLGTMEFKSYHLNYQCGFKWSELVNFQEIKCWAYVDDIFPKGGKE